MGQDRAVCEAETLMDVEHAKALYFFFAVVSQEQPDTSGMQDMLIADLRRRSAFNAPEASGLRKNRSLPKSRLATRKRSLTNIPSQPTLYAMLATMSPRCNVRKRGPNSVQPHAGILVNATNNPL